MKIKLIILSAGIILLFAQSFFASAQTEVPQLFTDTSFQTASDEQEEFLYKNLQNEENNPYILQNRYVEINYLALDGQGSFELNLFDGVRLIAQIDRVNQRSLTEFTYFGVIVGEPFSQVTIVLNLNRVTGNINYKDKVYSIRWMGAFVHSVAEIDWSNIPRGAPPLEGNSSSSNQLESVDVSTNVAPASSTDDGTSIDVLVVYTQAAAALGDVQSEIQLAMDNLNQALSNINVDLTFRLVHTAMVEYEETAIAHTDLSRIRRSQDGFMDGVLDLRDLYGADLVALITETMNVWGGLGYLLSSVPNEGSGFHVTRRIGLTFETFAHEIGHNLGMQHEKFQDSSGGAYSYSHGYVDTVNQFRTIMSYGTECSFSGCPSINYFSSAPSSGVTYNGFVIGDATNADNRQTVINTKLAISRFRQSKSSSDLTDEDVQKGCFIATAAYGSYLDPHVQALRDFRDHYLEPYTLGQIVMRFYYKNSPPLANLIDQNKILKLIARTLLTPLVYAISTPRLFLFSFIIIIFIWRRVKQKEGRP